MQDAWKIVYKDIVLRDMVESDVEDDIRWNTEQTEWALWDAPWEMEEALACFDPAAYREKELKRIADAAERRAYDDFRWEVELDHRDGTHIGSLNTYLIDEEYEWVEWVGREGMNGVFYYALGIEINEPSFWNSGIGKDALCAYIEHHFEHGHFNIALQTWSGNIRMVKCAERLGFKIVDREIGFRKVRGEVYDGLTFVLDADEFRKYRKQSCSL